MLAIWVKVRVKPTERQRSLYDSAKGAGERGEMRRAVESLKRLMVGKDEKCQFWSSARAYLRTLPGQAEIAGQDENVYYFYEVYKDEAALEAHRKAPHYAVWRAAADALDGPTEPVRCKTVFPADRGYWGKP